MHAFRSTARVASQFRPAAFPRFARGYASSKTYEHLLVSTPKPGVGFSELFSTYLSLHPHLHSQCHP
jgi:enoyl-CoA hydratase